MESVEAQNEIVAFLLIRTDIKTPIDLGNGIQIRKILPDEFDTLFPGIEILERCPEGWVTRYNAVPQDGSHKFTGITTVYSGMSLSQFSSAEHALVFTSTGNPQLAQIRTYTINRLLALCFGKGATMFASSMRTDSKEWAIFNSGYSYPALIPAREWSRPTITKQHIEDFSKCYEAVMTNREEIDSLFNLDLALEYFLHSCSDIPRPNDIRPTLQFSILNLLFSPEKDNVYKNIRARCSKLTGQSKKSVNKLLEKRGTLAHQGVNEFTNQELQLFEKITRDSLTRSIADPASLGAIRNKFNRNKFGNFLRIWNQLGGLISRA